MLRTALLINSKIVLFQANVFDGLFFLSTGPDQIREALGIPSYQSLPIEILVQTTDLNTLRDTITKNATSAQFAMGLSRSEFEFLYDRPNHVTYSNESDFEEWLQAAQEPWIEAIRSEEVKIKNFNLVGRSFPFRQVLLDFFTYQPQIDPQIIPLMIKMYSQSPLVYRRDQAEMTELKESVGNTLEDLRTCIQSNDALIERRWEIVTYLAQSPFDPQEKKLLFIHWNTMYLRALSSQHGINFLSFDFNNDPAYSRNLSKIGLTVNRKMSKLEKKTVLKVQGSIIEAMLKLGPSTYYELQATIHENQELTMNDRLTNLALTLENTGAEYVDYRKIRGKILRSFILFLPPSLILSLSEIGVLPIKGAFQWVWMLSVFFLGLPFNEMASLFKLEQSKISGQYIIQN